MEPLQHSLILPRFIKFIHKIYESMKVKSILTNDLYIPMTIKHDIVHFQVSEIFNI